jgi:tetratricopeptide (TPR) repeat protein
LYRLSTVEIRGEEVERLRTLASLAWVQADSESFADPCRDAPHRRCQTDFFERALAADPSFAEARVRLAKVRFDQGKPRETLTLLRDLAQAITDDIVSYYAQLVLGDAAAALGQNDLAVPAYRRAAVLFPTAQTPRLAPSLIFRRSGNVAAALTAISPVFSFPDDPMERPDPWWVDHKGEGRYASSLIAELIRAIPPAQ